MLKKVLWLVLLLAIAGGVWYLASGDKNFVGNGGQEENKEMVEAFIAGDVSSVEGDLVKFKIGKQDFTARISADTQLIKNKNLLGKLTEEPAERSELKAGVKILVYYMVEKDRDVNEPLLILPASKIIIQ